MLLLPLSLIPYSVRTSFALCRGSYAQTSRCKKTVSLSSDQRGPRAHLRAGGWRVYFCDLYAFGASCSPPPPTTGPFLEASLCSAAAVANKRHMPHRVTLNRSILPRRSLTRRLHTTVNSRKKRRGFPNYCSQTNTPAHKKKKKKSQPLSSSSPPAGCREREREGRGGKIMAPRWIV